MKISMHELVEGEGRVLAGAINGRKVWTSLLELTNPESDHPEPVFLDFQGVEVATASFLRESVLAFRDAVRQRRSNLYPIIANANELVEDELRLLVAGRGDAVMLCSLDEEGQPRERHLVGELDPKQRFTFDRVQELGETGAAELMREYGDREKTRVQTAWNNRLAALASLGLIVELSQGRAKRYRSLLGEA